MVVHVPHRDWPIDLEVTEADLPAGLRLQELTPSQLEASDYGSVRASAQDGLEHSRLCFVDGYRMLTAYMKCSRHT